MSPPPIPSFKPVKELRDVRVLVVDDDRRIAKLVRSVLLGLGFQDVELVHDGVQALNFLKTTQIDMIICDWQMEPMDGILMIDYLRKHDHGPNSLVPVIMLSGNSERPQVEAARDAGITEYVIKPFTAKSLCSRIVAVIDNPRSFIISKHYAGHNRRRKTLDVPAERRKRKPNPKK